MDGTVIPWKNNLRDTAENIAKDLNLRVESAEKISNDMKGNGSIEISSDESNKIYRKIAGVSPDENILLNGIVVGKSFSADVTLVAENGILTEIIGGNIKHHGVEKLGTIDLNTAIVKTGLLRRSKVKPRIIESYSTKKLLKNNLNSIYLT